MELRSEKKLVNQGNIKKAVESRRYIVKFDRLLLTHGGMIDLMPRTNYIVVDGSKTIISAAYLGRQYDIRLIEGINLIGKSTNYELISDYSKGMYEIKMKVSGRGSTFDVYISIGKDGYCSASLTNMRLDHIKYYGHIVPIKGKTTDTNDQGQII